MLKHSEIDTDLDCPVPRPPPHAPSPHQPAPVPIVMLSIRSAVKAAQPAIRDEPGHQLRPGDWVNLDTS
ncbi:hypothetical protein COCON_G00085740 [Conger conger]|uniref:Uncharacterized protein n=1 Tax=Conger conger TaxID=82655 RepID=A0A9Q1HYK2_CONCO|nr:hypothetical protein COCON_G00085740 [Conger conger]